jgi:hypothetical protein
MRALLPLLALLCSATAPLPGAAADPTAPPVTVKNLLASERFWPYHVALAKAWTPPGQPQALPAGTRGVLIRVESADLARVDFGRDGLFAVPVDATDLVAQAERVRRGELPKTAPNFALAIGPRLLDSSATPLRPVDFQQTAQRPGFLAVFADPTAEGFPALAKALAPLRGRGGVETILFPQGSPPDAQVAERLRSLDFPVPFVNSRMSEPYTRTLLADPARFPSVTLQTGEGRLLYADAWSEQSLPALSAALAESFKEPAKR